MTTAKLNFSDAGAIATLELIELPDPGYITLADRYLQAGSLIAANQVGDLRFTLEAPPLPVQPAQKYAYQRHFLGQPVPEEFTPSQLGGSPYDWRGIGMTIEYVDRGIGWHWDKKGGDWLDADRVRYGAKPWFELSVNCSTDASIQVDTVDVTSLARFVQEQDRWFALLVRISGRGRCTFAGAKHDTQKPLLMLEYEDGTSETVPAFYTAWFTSGTTYVKSCGKTVQAPFALEFDRPKRPVRSATLLLPTIGVTAGACKITGMLLDPPVNNEPVQHGVAAACGLFDAGITEQPGVMGAHRYVDGSARDDFISNCGLTTTSERDHSPDLWGRGERNRNLLPDRDNGKWIAAGQQFKLVDSSYREHGFHPLAPGLGALEVTMAKEPGIGNGSVINQTGTSGSKARIYMPHELYGLQEELFVRYYVMVAPFDASFASRYEYYRGKVGGPVVWADKGGKWGITVSHTNRYGFSGSSGGGYGHQMRDSWAIRDLEIGAPTGGCIVDGLHTFDYQKCNPPGHQYGNDAPRVRGFGQRGGLGGIIWPGMWYLREERVKLNSVMPDAPGYIANGEVDAWYDGRLAFSRRGMVMRSLPLVPMAYKDTSIRPARELGVAYLDFCWYHGGTTENPIDMRIFITGLVWGTKYIGPMRLPG